MRTSTNKLNQAIERMTTGAKINHAKDNAANYSIATNMTTRINSYMVAEDNALQGLDMVTTISDNLDLLKDHATRIRELCEQASNGTYGEQSLKAIQSEIDARLEEIERIKSSAEYNGIKLLDGEPSEGGVTGKFLAPVTQLTEDEAIAQGYTIIKTADELQAMKNNLSGKYILMNDINLDGYDWTPVGSSVNKFSGELNGNGFIIKNLTINSNESNVGFFGYLNEAIIHNVAIENASITAVNTSGWTSVGILVGTYDRYDGVFFENCYVTGTASAISSDAFVGGLMGSCSTGQRGDIIDCYVDAVLNGSTTYKRAFCGLERDAGIGSITNSYYINTKTVSLYSSAGITSTELNALIIPPSVSSSEKTINLQVGIFGNSDSQISLNLELLNKLSDIDTSSSDSARACLSTLDDYINSIGDMQTNIGAVQNRLESVLDEISIQYDNLVSSRSTIKDADIAKVSAEYIQQQILQQAAATLMSTANQSPAIALQLI